MNTLPILAELNAGGIIVLVLVGGIILAAVIQVLAAMDPAAKASIPHDSQISTDHMAPATYHVWIQNAVCGPYTAAELRVLKQQGQIHAGTLMQTVGGDDWLPLTTYADVLAAPRPPMQVLSTPAVMPPAKTGDFNLTKAGLIIMMIALASLLALGLDLMTMLLFTAGLILLVVGLTRK
jgi:hypothetical protein